MQANWSLILNVLLLIGVVVFIGRLMKARRRSFNQSFDSQPLPALMENHSFDDIIAVRKIVTEDPLEPLAEQAPLINSGAAKLSPLADVEPCVEPVRNNSPIVHSEPEKKTGAGQSLMIFLLAKEKRNLAGYELLQTILAAGLRFGEDQLFHRHQQANGQGSVLCSLASATASGVFDLQNIGAFSVRGLCLFMQISDNPDTDALRFSTMLETARQLRDDLDTLLLDERQQPLTDDGISQYCRRLNISHLAVSSAPVEMA